MFSSWYLLIFYNVSVNGSLNCSKEANSVKFVNGGLPLLTFFVILNLNNILVDVTVFLKIPLSAVAVVPGRTRTLVERFERRERFDRNEDQATRISSPVIPEDQATSRISPVTPEDKVTSTSGPMIPEVEASISNPVIPEVEASISSPVIPEVETSISSPVIPEREKTSTRLVNFLCLKRMLF